MSSGSNSSTSGMSRFGKRAFTLIGGLSAIVLAVGLIGEFGARRAAAPPVTTKTTSVAAAETPPRKVEPRSTPAPAPAPAPQASVPASPPPPAPAAAPISEPASTAVPTRTARETVSRSAASRPVQAGRAGPRVIERQRNRHGTKSTRRCAPGRGRIAQGARDRDRASARRGRQRGSYGVGSQRAQSGGGADRDRASRLAEHPGCDASGDVRSHAAQFGSGSALRRICFAPRRRAHGNPGRAAQTASRIAAASATSPACQDGERGRPERGGGPCAIAYTRRAA
jgi:hypothetical protein